MASFLRPLCFISVVFTASVVQSAKNPLEFKWQKTLHPAGQTCLPIAGYVNVPVAINCVTKSSPHLVVNDSYCTRRKKPSTVAKVYLESCPVTRSPCPVWKAGLWGPCLSSEDGNLEQTRNVSCVDDHTLLKLPNENLCNSVKPITKRPC